MTGERKSRQTGNRRWSGKVTRESNALDLEPGVLEGGDAHRIALSLKRSGGQPPAQVGALRSAMSMLTFYINRAGKGLTDEQRRTLEAAKDELRKVFHRKA